MNRIKSMEHSQPQVLKNLNMLQSIFTALLFLCIFHPFSLYAETEVSGSVSGRWTVEGSPYIITDSTWLEEEDTLIVEGGVEIEFDGDDFELNLQGLWLFESTEDEYITFFSDFEDNYLRLKRNPNYYEQADTLTLSYLEFDMLESYVIFYATGVNYIINSDFIDGQFDINGEFDNLPNPSITWSNNLFYNNFAVISQNCNNLEFVTNIAAGAIGIHAFFISNLNVSDNSGSFYYDFWSVNSCNVTSDTTYYYSFLNCGQIDINRTTVSQMDGDGNFNLNIDSSIVGYVDFESHGGSFIANFCEFNRLATDGSVEISNCIISGYATFREDVFADRVTFSRNAQIIGGDQDHIVGFSRFSRGYEAELNNCIFLGDGSMPYAIDIRNHSVRVRNCLFSGVFERYTNGEPHSETNILETDPLFDPWGEPFELLASSPCRDAGRENSPLDPDGTTADMGGRFFDTRYDHPPQYAGQEVLWLPANRDVVLILHVVDDGNRSPLIRAVTGIPYGWFERDEDSDRYGVYLQDSLRLSGTITDLVGNDTLYLELLDDAGHFVRGEVPLHVINRLSLAGAIEGTLSANESPFLITGPVWVSENDTLIINAGVDIAIAPGPYRNPTPFRVYGRIEMNGTENDSIVFQIYSPENEGAVWGGLQIQESGSIEAHNTVFSDGYPGVTIDCDSALIDSCTFIDNHSGLSFNHGGTVQGCTFVNDVLSVNNISYGRTPFIIDGSRFYGPATPLSSSAIGIQGFCDINNTEIFDYASGIYIMAHDTIRIDNVFISNTTRGLYFITQRNHSIYVNHLNIFSNVETAIDFNGGDLFLKNSVINGAETVFDIGGPSNDHRAVYITNCDILNSELFMETSSLSAVNELIIENSNIISCDSLIAGSERIISSGFSYNNLYDVNYLGDALPEGLGQLVQTNVNGDSCDEGFNIYLDPVFEGGDPFSLRLMADSPCIDAGNPDLADLDGTIADIGSLGGPLGESYDYPTYVPDDIPEIPTESGLVALYPIPFNTSLTIVYGLSKQSEVSLRIYDILGRLVLSRNLPDDIPGYKHFIWDGKSTSGVQIGSGMYFIELTAENHRNLARVVMLK
ncbi:MAG: FlgD immunoglobulin-like domain containing protein [Candidatus Electryonea clarkiae]|nr:FlgD immunoglobulin-like domain containing protein [Candidatus Electryonea clarkiae]MDP8288719.1 FlgD immunoglobulin-like domain containing protein [Candidatus Electryonea clarkiae]